MANPEPRLALVTGARGGIGSELCKNLVRKGYRVILLDRNDSADLTAQLVALHPNSVADTVQVDLTDHGDIARACASLRARWTTLDLLFNNAGVLPDSLTMSKNGNELDFEVNTLAPLQLMDGLRPLLAAATAATIVNTTAGISLSVPSLDIEDLRKPKEFKKLFGPYVASKQALNVLTQAVAREFAADGIAVRAVDPGPNRTKLTKGSGTPLWMRMFSALLPGPSVGARRIVDGALAPVFQGKSGIVISGDKIKALPASLSDAAFQDALLAACRKLAG